MLKEKIINAARALNELAPELTEKQWEMIRLARTELLDAADQVGRLEKELTVPPHTPYCRCETVESNSYGNFFPHMPGSRISRHRFSFDQITAGCRMDDVLKNIRQKGGDNERQ